MSVQITIEYLSKLLNQTIADDAQISLSSAQKSRLHAWLTKNNISFSEAVLSKKFTISELLGCGGKVFSSITTEVRKRSLIDSSLSGAQSAIGIDIQQIDELFPNGLPADPKADEGLTQIFTLNELSYAQSKESPKQTLTGIFCAKEAIQKISNQVNRLNEIEVLHNQNGRPISHGYAISISHSKSYAIAVATHEVVNAQVVSTEFCAPIESTVLSSTSPSDGEISSNNRLRPIDYLYLVLIGALLFVTVFK